MQRIVAGIVGVLMTCSVLVACGTDQPSSSSAHTLVAQADAVPTPKLGWGPCTEAGLSDYKCAGLQVPLDYSRPRGPQITLAVLGHFVDPAKRAGVLVAAAGGPGDSAISQVMNGGLVASGLFDRFDMITFDQRGVGRSNSVRCFTDPAVQGEFWKNLDIPPVNAEQQQYAITAAKQYADDCNRTSGAILPYLTTADAARDLDLLRRALGQETLNFTGVSYGSYLGEVYAALFGKRLRAIQLNSLIDPQDYTNNSVGASAVSAAATEDVFHRFLQLCAANSSGCAFAHARTAAQLELVVDTIYDRLAVSTITVGDTPSALVANYRDVLDATANLLLSPGTGWPLLGQLYAGLEAGRVPYDPEPARNAVLGGAFPTDFMDAFTAISCADMSFPRDPSYWSTMAAQSRSAAPRFGGLYLYLRQPCSVWPMSSGGYPQRYTGPWTYAGKTPALLINNQNDPITPAANALRAREEMGHARSLIIDDGYGHDPNGTCADLIRIDYFVNLKVPAPGTTCRPDTAPFTGS